MSNYANKYQPYHGYGCAHPFIWYGNIGPCPVRVRTRGDWRWNVRPRVCAEFHMPHWRERMEWCDQCGIVHCAWCGCYAPWHRPDKSSNGSRYEKRLAHRTFRRWARHAIVRELRGDDAVSHNFRYCGDWLD